MNCSSELTWQSRSLPLSQCLNDAQNDIILKTCFENCQCPPSGNVVACTASQDACDLKCAFQHMPPSCTTFINDVVLDLLGLTCPLVNVYQLLVGSFQCILSSPPTAPPPATGLCNSGTSSAGGQCNAVNVFQGVSSGCPCLIGSTTLFCHCGPGSPT